MSKSCPKSDKQISILDYLKNLSRTDQPSEGQARCIEPLRDALRQAIKQCSLSRHQIAGEMSHLVGETITREMIDSWTREDQQTSPFDPPSKGESGGEKRIKRHIPAEYLPAFCRATGSNDALRILGEASGVFVLPGPEALRAEIQRLDEEIRERQDKKRKRAMFLREMEK